MAEIRIGPGLHESHFSFYVPERRIAMMKHMFRFVNEEEGATALEYGLLAALIAAAIIGAVTTLGSTVSNTFSSIATSMANASGA